MMTSGDPMDTCPHCGKIYYTVNGHYCEARQYYYYPFSFAPFQDFNKIEYLSRLQKAIKYLEELISSSTDKKERRRLKGKLEGVKLAEGYFLEMTKENGNNM